VIFPLPFSLVSPADSARVPTVVPTFVWRATTDPNPGSPLLYTLWLDDLDDPGNPACVPAGSDTMLTLPFPLTPDRTYRWEVTVEDPAGHRRTSRETHTIFSPSIEGVDDPPPATASRGLRLRCAPNPCAGPLRLRCELPESTAGIGASGAPAEADCSWALYDPLGRRVAAGSAPWGDGFAEDNWDGNAADGRPAGPGVYYLEVRAGWRFARETVLRVAR